MAKISPVSIKYIIYAKFEAEGTVEKPDVIGALFGQTEGLLGSDLELRELQKEGKIGRIDVNLENQDGKTTGKIEIPSSLDKAETTIIAAALETIERIGPSDSKIEIEKIEDVRGNKRDYIIDRAKKLLEKIEGSTESREIGDAVRVSSRTSKLQEYGNDNLPAGDISGNEIIVVEGRADVINMLKAGVKNVIAMNGTILPETIKELSHEKETTLFVDGDRGGQLIAKNAIDNARIDYVAKAPDGKEVEELTPKEILISLRKKLKVEEFLEDIRRNERRTRTERKQGYRRERTDREERTSRSRTSYEKTQEKEKKEKKTEKIEKMSEKEKEKMKEIMEEITGTKGAILLDKNLEIIRKIPLSQLQNQRTEVYAVVVDGTATAFVVKAAESLNCKHLIARNFAYAETDIDLISL
ncbi:MAG TPA: DNA primase DnaG [Candidatus Paceibacterota bacterium]|nr:DNA primase DnaG [Candidatus Paceibacterota bacterium]